MTFSARATELSHDLDRTVAQLEAHSTVIATELAKGAGTDKKTSLTAAHQIARTVSAHHNFVRAVKDGPDVPPRPAARTAGPPSVDWPTLERRTRDIGPSIAQWPLVQHYLTRLLVFDRQALYPEHNTATDVLNQMTTATDDVWNILHGALNPQPQDPDAKEAGGFADIPLPQSAFFSHLQAAARVCVAQERDRAPRFLDVGCGSGLKVLSATRFFTRSDGLEFDAGYAAAARKLLKSAHLDDCTIHDADALTFEDYGDYDVIYFYRPLKNDAKLQELEQRIATQAPARTLLIAPYPTFAYRYQQLNCGRIAGQLYLTQSSDADALALREAAEIIAPYELPLTFAFAPLWKPIGAALRARTFD